MRNRTRDGWLKLPIAIWYEKNTAFVSVVFSWDLGQAHKLCEYLGKQGYRVRAGGPAVRVQPNALADVADVTDPTPVNALARHNPDATYTTTGCPRKCPFCIESLAGEGFAELPDGAWEPRRLVCDSNFLACSDAHFNRVIDRLKPIRRIDFNQGLDCRFLTPERADRLAELDLLWFRLAWDDIRVEKAYRRAVEIARGAGIGKDTISTYVLIGFRDTPEDALYRLREARRIGGYVFPMIYQPLKATAKYAYVSPAWEKWQLIAYTRYWSTRRIESTPFEAWLEREYRRARAGVRWKQLTLSPLVGDGNLT
jgi:hypothetical protein